MDKVRSPDSFLNPARVLHSLLEYKPANEKLHQHYKSCYTLTSAAATTGLQALARFWQVYKCVCLHVQKDKFHKQDHGN